MMSRPWVGIVAFFLFGAFLHAQCAGDQRSNKNAGILVTDFTITGTQTISATELARVTSDLIGTCFDEDSDELGERVRASFQERGYFAVKVNSLAFKPLDPLGVPKPVTLVAEISDGPRYKLAEITFVENHAFSSGELRRRFALKKGDLFERGKVARGLESLRKLYTTQGFLDFTAIPDTKFGSNATVNLGISIQEGPQYHMGKLDIVADKEVAEGCACNGSWLKVLCTTPRTSISMWKPIGICCPSVSAEQASKQFRIAQKRQPKSGS
jgi:hypothetical protein